MIREPAWDQLGAADDDDDPPVGPECVECGEPTANEKQGKPCCPECDPPHDCSDDPCDRHNPYLRE